MSMYDIYKREQIVTCPYDPAHRIVAKKLTTHLVKCGRNHRKRPDDKYFTCPYNANHRILTVEKPYHLTECPDKILVERAVLTLKTRDTGLQVNKIKSPDGAPLDDNWDEDLAYDSVPPYDPKTKIDEVDLRNSTTLCELKPAERRAYYKNLLVDFNKGDVKENPPEPKYVAPVPTALKRLRLPKTESIVVARSRCGSSSASTYGVDRQSIKSYSGSAAGSVKSMQSLSGKFENLMAISKGRGIRRQTNPPGATNNPSVGRPMSSASGYLSSDYSFRPDSSAAGSFAGSFMPEDLPIVTYRSPGSYSCSSSDSDEDGGKAMSRASNASSRQLNRS